jgi:hypothetical protein
MKSNGWKDIYEWRFGENVEVDGRGPFLRTIFKIDCRAGGGSYGTLKIVKNPVEI